MSAARLAVEQGLRHLEAGRLDEARRVFAAHEARVGSVAGNTMLVQRADRLLRAGDVRSAAALYGQILSRNPTRPEPYLGLARIALFLGDAAAARAQATAATRLAPSLGRAWTLLGLAHETAGALQRAVPLLMKGAALTPNDAFCQLNLGRALAAVGRLAEGRMALWVATGLDPKNAAGFTYLGIVLRQEGNGADAVVAFARACDLAPQDPTTWATLADVQFAQRDFAAARATLVAGLTRCGDVLPLLEKATACALALRDVASAIGFVERGLGVAPLRVPAWLNLAALCLLAGDFDGSERAARRALALDPKSSEGFLALGNLYDAARRDDAAEEAYRQAVALAPGDARPLTNLAAVLIQREGKARHLEAVQLLERALSHRPDDWRVQYNLALAHVRVGQKARALTLARKIVSGAPSTGKLAARARVLEGTLAAA